MAGPKLFHENIALYDDDISGFNVKAAFAVLRCRRQSVSPPLDGSIWSINRECHTLLSTTYGMLHDFTVFNMHVS